MPARQQLLDVEIALGMAAAGGVGVGELVDQHQRRPALQDGVEVHLLERAAAILDLAARQRPRGPRAGPRSRRGRGSRRRRPRRRCPLSGAGAPPAASRRSCRRPARRRGRLFSLPRASFSAAFRRASGEGRVSSPRAGMADHCHRLASASRARLSRSTLTRGSPSTPNSRPSCTARPDAAGRPPADRVPWRPAAPARRRPPARYADRGRWPRW